MSKTRDHLVPQMYLKQWATLRNQRHHLQVAHVETLERPFTTSVANVAVEGDYYRGTTPEGVESHDMEAFLSRIEDLAAPALRALMGTNGNLGPDDDAFPRRWPPRPQHREAISWWLAAQLLRTDHQRQRLWNQMDRAPISLGLGMPRVEDHLAYIAILIEPLAALIWRRPWGFGWADVCLATSDVPAVIVNGQHEDDQLLAASFWDIYLPLDPHRFLYLPGASHGSAQARRRDHKFKLDGGQALALAAVTLSSARRHVFFAERHNPWVIPAAPRERHTQEHAPRFHLRYTVLRDGFGIQRRWLDLHPAARTPQVAASQPPGLQPGDRLPTEFREMLDDFEQAGRDWAAIKDSARSGSQVSHPLPGRMAD